MKIRRALISVSDRTGLEELAAGLVELNVAIVCSGGTARVLSRAGIPFTPVSEVTGMPEMLDGRLKTLHPRIHGGILADRRKPHHLSQLKEYGIAAIDMVVCNLYPFAETIARPDVSEADAIEQIDIGGPSMVRAAAKNHKWVAVVVNPQEYPEILREMRLRAGGLSDETRARLAAEAFAHTAAYDIAVSRWMGRDNLFPDAMLLDLTQQMTLRYGENPHQAGAFYAVGSPSWLQLGGKELSYTNLLDLDAAWRLISEFDQPAVAIIKHNNACGCAVADTVEEAYRRALECDPRSAFGGIVAANRDVDGPTVKRILDIMTELVIAPGFTREALAGLEQRKNLRVIEAKPFADSFEIRAAADGYLVQQWDDKPDPRKDMVVVTHNAPADREWADLLFAWKVCKHVKSNAIVFAADGQAVGIGAGQTSRVEAVEVAARRAGDRSKGSVCASDGFFPFRDGLDAAVAAGARAVIQPGGSVRDSEVIAAADELGIAMVFTGRRHFRH
ncbi:MAG TPA: bifunctional phosphoribosylaminoimidazolecarboxamide formyltransferase/IMP cyclohydrolase [Actinomycetota bacterium]|jgi:phosphoribosylaminoimidazolecarboxamide formyltransferase/IMP cyclohydrolase